MYDLDDDFGDLDDFDNLDDLDDDLDDIESSCHIELSKWSNSGGQGCDIALLEKKAARSASGARSARCALPVKVMIMLMIMLYKICARPR